MNYYYSIDGENYFSSEDAYYEFINLPQEDYIVYVYAEDAALNKSLVVTRSLRLGTPAVRIDDDYYFSIEKAANASSSGDTLIVLRDIVENADIPVGKNFTLDIAGYTIYSNYSTTIDVYGSDVTITDSTWDEEHPYGTGMFTFLPDVEGNGTGGAIYGDEYSNITLEHLTIKGNSASLGGGVYHKGNLILDSVLIEENHASSNGGGLFSKSGTISFKNNTVISNNTATNAGGIYISTITSYESDGTSEIKGNTATANGGGINIQGADLTIDKLTIMNNTANQGAGIYGVAKNTILDNMTIKENTATYGGGITVASSASLEIKNSNINNNNSTYGGGIFSNCSLTIDNSVIDSNEVTSDGGGIYVFQNNANRPVTFSLKNNTVISNNTAKNAGGMYIATITKFESDGTSKIKGNSAGAGGGLAISSASLNVSNIEVLENKASAYGAGIYISSKNVTLDNVKVHDQTLTGNAYASGIHVYKTGSLTIKNSEVKKNKTAKNGAGLYLNGPTTIINTVIDENTSSSLGGGIYAETTDSSNLVTLLMDENTIISNNKASYGGGISVNTPLTISNATITKNTATSRGGGLYINDNVTLDNLKITDNICNIYGGGIFLDEGKDLIIGNTLIDNNTSSYDGGGINSNGSITLNDGAIISNNHSDTIGGGIREYQPDGQTLSFQMNGTSKVINNTANDDGGGISASKISNMNLSSGLIDNNTSHNGQGGGLALQNIEFQMGNSFKISNNTAINGGGLFLNSSSVGNVSGGEISSNEAVLYDEEVDDAQGYGGGIFVLNSTLNVNGGSIISNSAFFGGGVQGNTKSIVNINGGVINSNTADNSGGGIGMLAGTLIINNGTLSSNTCTTLYCASAVEIEGASKLNLYGGLITNNTCKSDSAYCGAISLDGRSDARATFNIHGAPIVKDNVSYTGLKANLTAINHFDAYIDGAMTDGAYIGVNHITAAFSPDFLTYSDDTPLVDYSSYFINDTDAYKVTFDSANRKLKVVNIYS